MKKVMSFALILVLLLSILSGCSGGGASSSGSQAASGGATSSGAASGAESTGGSSDRQTKDEIIFAQGQDIYSLDYVFTRTERTYSLTTHIYQSLVIHDPDVNVKPCLATKWEWIDDLTMRFYLREGVKFHNGETMTAEDVAFSFNRVRDEPYMANNTSWLKSVEVESENTVIFNLTMPYSPLVSMLCHPAFGVVPKAYVEANPEILATAPVGTGPYKMGDYRQGEYYTLERFDDYWEGPAKTKYLTMKIIPEASQRTIMLETGSIDAAYEIPMNDIAKVEANDKLQIYSGPSMKVYIIYLNTASSGPMGDKKVREALNHAIDKQALVDAVVYGYGTPANNIIPESIVGFEDRSADMSYDPALAKKMLEEAGYSEGDLNLTIWTSSETNRVELSEIYASMLQEIGVNLEVQIIDQNASDARWAAGEEFDMYLHFYNNQPAHADMTLYSTLTTGLDTNKSRYDNPIYNELVLKIRATNDDAELKDLCYQCFEIIYEDYPMIPVYNEIRYVATSKNLEGLALNQVGAHKFTNVVVYAD